MALTLKRWIILNTVLFVVFIGTIVLFSFLGHPIIPLTTLFESGNSLMKEVLFQARFPRVLLAASVGAGLSVAGVAFQALLRNSLADPYILGVSGGAALGGVLALALGLSFHALSLVSFLSALGALFLIYWIAQVEGRLPVHALLLTGVIFNSFAFALILLISSVANMGQMHQIFFLIMGSLEAQSIHLVIWVGGIICLGAFILFLNSSKMNLISLGEESATQLGLNVERYRKIVFIAASLIVGASVAIAGLIGFVGLFVPHILRLILGSDHRLLIPASFFGGGIFLVICDFFAKNLFATGSLQTQLPVGVITALIGGPFFVYLLKK